MAKLYELKDELLELFDLADGVWEEEDPTFDWLQQLLERTEKDFTQKLVQMSKLVQNLESEEKGIRDEVQRLQKRARSIKRHAREVRDYMATCLREVPGHRVSDGTTTCRLQRGSVKLDEDHLNEEAIPKDYWVPQDPKLDRRRLVEDLKDGVSVPGAKLAQGSHVVIT